MDVKRAIHFTASLPPQKATAVFRVVARPDGKIVSIDVARPSAFPHIDSEMRRAMLSGGRVPPAPAGHSGTGIFKVTVNYHR